jgi:hypothetical protein
LQTLKEKKGGVMTAISRPPLENVRQAHLHEASGVSLPTIVDFVPVRDRLRKETDQTIRQFEIEQEIRKAAALRQRSVNLYDPLEDWLYSVVPAAAVIALLIGVLGLLDSPNTKKQPIDVKGPGLVEQSSPTQDRADRNQAIRPIQSNVNQSLARSSRP